MRKPAADKSELDDIEVGAFFLETLTTGMYENPFHCIREYVQNGSDAISDAIRLGQLKDGDGRISIALGGTGKSQSLTVRDNGTGIPRDRAHKTLVSIGASRKLPAHHAGFRGIGRLAGIAYCTTLRFTTTFAGEDVATIVEFDCGRIRGHFTPGAEAQDIRALLTSAVRRKVTSAIVGDHYTEVEMSGLVNLGLEFVDMTKLQPYLQQVCPVDYVESFDFADRIRGIGVSYGEPLKVVHVEAQLKRERVPIYKAYRNTAPVAKKNTLSILTDIEAVSSKEHGWYGWIGVSNFPGELVDPAVAGVRFRMKNIQVGDVRIIEDIAEGIARGKTERRLQRWAVGEVFITNPQVIPNARRDGFEDGAAWRTIKQDIGKAVAQRVTKLLRAASDSRTLLKEISEHGSRLAAQIAVPSVTAELREKLATEIRRRIQMLETKGTFTGVRAPEVAALLAQFQGYRVTLTTLPETEPKVEPVAPEPNSTATPPVDEAPDKAPGGADQSAAPGSAPLSELDVVYEVLLDELGESEADRLFEIILGRLDLLDPSE